MLERLAGYPKNKGAVQQFAIRQASEMLSAAGVQFPEQRKPAETPIFPEGAIRLPDLTIGGKTAKQLEKTLASEGVRVSDYARELLRSKDFTTLKDEKTLGLVKIAVKDMGLKGNPTTDQIYERANELGLDLCPAEVGPHLRLTTKDQSMGDYFYIGMKQIADSHGDPLVFKLHRDEDGLWLNDCWAHPDGRWFPGSEFVFSLRK